MQTMDATMAMALTSKAMTDGCNQNKVNIIAQVIAIVSI